MEFRDAIEFDENIFRDFYNKWMDSEAPLVVDVSLSILEQVIVNNIKLDFNTVELSCLDIGCACGKHLISLKQNSIIQNAKGIDISNLMIERAIQSAENHGVDISYINSSIELYNTEDKYDIIIASEVLEHLINPIECLKKITTLMSENGFFYGSVPLGNTCDTEVHFNHYSMDSLYELLFNSFKRITIIPINVSDKSGVHLFFRCQKEMS